MDDGFGIYRMAKRLQDEGWLGYFATNMTLFKQARKYGMLSARVVSIVEPDYSSEGRHRKDSR